MRDFGVYVNGIEIVRGYVRAKYILKTGSNMHLRNFYELKIMGLIQRCIHETPLNLNKSYFRYAYPKHPLIYVMR